MGCVPGYRHDLFVSYAHMDDVPLSGATRGWVTTLVGNLETVVRQKLSKEFEIWTDHELAGNKPLTAAIMEALAHTAALMVVISPAYLASDWCRRERLAFLELIKDRRTRGGPVFIVHYDKVDRSGVPPEFGDLIGYPFWVEEERGKAPRTLGIPLPTPAETEYYSRVNQLAHEIAEELKNLRQGEIRAGTGAQGPTVFLAEVTDDLESKREEVRRYLSQAGLSVLPQRVYPRDDSAAFERAMSEDLAGCKVFVQLLSAFGGRRPPILPQGYPCLQYEIARRAKVKVLQWRSRDLNLAGIEDTYQRALLDGETVRACSIEEFKQAIVEEACAEVRPETPRGVTDIFVFVTTDAPDRRLAEEVARILLEQGVGYSMPLERGNPEEIRADLEDNLRTCDGLLIIYGETTAGWVRSQLRQCRKVITQREQPLSALAVYEGPPPEKIALDFMLPNLQRLDCRRGLDHSRLRAFVDSLRG